MKELILLFITLFFFGGCDQPKAEGLTVEKFYTKDFSDSGLCDLYDLQNQRDSKKLLKYLGHPKMKYRQLAAAAFGSIQSVDALPLLYDLLFDESDVVRKSAAFAIGQIESASEEKLIAAYLKNASPIVRASLLEAMGKVGNERSLSFILSQMNAKGDSVIGKLWGLVRLANRQVWSREATTIVLEVLENNLGNDEVSYVGSLVFRSLKQNYCSGNHIRQLIHVFNENKNLDIRSSIVVVIARDTTEQSISVISALFENGKAPVLISALKNLTRATYLNHRTRVEELLSASNRGLSVAASEFFINNSFKKHSLRYLSLANSDKYWRVGANLFRAALRSNPTSIAVFNAIKNRYEKTNNIYEKACLLRSLGESIQFYKYLAKETFNAKESILASYGMEALVDIRVSNSFELLNDKSTSKGGTDLKQDFALIMKKAIGSNVTSLIAIASELLLTPKYNFINTFENTYFLTQALHRLEIPRQQEAYNELLAVINYFNGELVNHNQSDSFTEIEWDLVNGLGDNTKVIVTTTKGDFIIAVKPNNSPSAVANFVSLVNQGFYNGKTIHTVSANAIVETGCSKGNSWGDTKKIIHSEFSDVRFKRGTVAMSCKGKDLLSTQWFIALAPSPQLNGNTTAFAEVSQGMEVVDRLELGDKILTVKLSSIN